MPKLKSKVLPLVIFSSMISCFMLDTSAQASCSTFEVTGTTIISENECDIDVIGGSPGDTLTIENGVDTGPIDFGEFPYELFNRGTINGNSPGVFFAGDGIVNNDGTGAEIFGTVGDPGVEITGSGEVHNSGQSARIFSEGIGVSIGFEGVGEGLVVNSGANAIIEGGETGVSIEGNGEVINSGLSAIIRGGIGDTGIHITGNGIVTNSGINALIEDFEGSAITIEGDGTVTNSGIGAKILGDDFGVEILGQGTVINSGQEALIQGSGDAAVVIEGESESATSVNTVTNSGAGAQIVGENSLGISMIGSCCADDQTFSVINSGLGAQILGVDPAIAVEGEAEFFTASVTNSGTNALIQSFDSDAIVLLDGAFDLNNTVTNSGSGAKIVGASSGVVIDSDSIMTTNTVTNSGANAVIEGMNGAGVLIISEENDSISNTIDNSGDNALISGFFDGVAILTEGNTITNTILNSGRNARIIGLEGIESGIHIEASAFGSEETELNDGTVTNVITQSGDGAQIIAEGGNAITILDRLCCEDIETPGDWDDPTGTHISTVTNSGQGARIEGFGFGADDPFGAGLDVIGDGHGVYMEAIAENITQEVINSGQGATIIGHQLFGEGVHMFANFIQEEEDGPFVPLFEEEGSPEPGFIQILSATQTVTNSGQGAIIEGVLSEGVELDAIAETVMQTVTNSGAGAMVLGGLAEGIDMNSLAQISTQTVTNSGAGATIESEFSGGVFMEAQALQVNQTVTNSGAGAWIRGGAFEDFIGGEGVQMEALGFESEPAATINQTVTNSGLGAVIDSVLNDGVEYDAFGFVINQTVTNSGDGAKIIGGDSSGIDIFSEGYQIDVKVTNSGLGSHIIGVDDEGVEINAEHTEYFDEEGSFFKANVTNSGEGALIMGRWDAVDIEADDCCSFETVTVDVINSGAGAMIHGEGGQAIDISTRDSRDEISSTTINIENTGVGSQILADMNTGVEIYSVSENLTVTVLQSGEGASIIGGGEEYEGGDGVKITGDTEDEPTGSFNATVTNSGAGARIQGHWDGVDIEAGCDDCESGDNAYDAATINVNNTGAGALIWGEMGQGVDIFIFANDGIVTVDNTGVGAEIRGYNYGVFIDNENEDGTSMVTNGNEAGGGALIRSTEEESTAVYMLGSGTVTNNLNSWIEGGPGGLGVGFGNSEPGFDNTFDNSGGVSCNGGCDSDAVYMAAGSDTVNLRTGTTILGNIDGGDDDAFDEVNLYGTGSFSYELQRFDDLNMNGVDWTLNGDGEHDIDTTEINSGILRLVDGTLGGDVNVNAGGTFAGNGFVDGTLTANAGGTIAPGASIGTMSTEDLDLSNGGNLEVEFSASDNDIIEVSGDTTLGGTSMATFVPYGTPLLDTRTFTFVDGNILIDDTFTTVNVPLSFTANVLYNGDCGDGDGDACVELTRTSTFEELGGSPNLKALGSILDEILTSNPTGPLLELFLLFDGLTTPEELEELLQQLTPEQQTSLIEMGLQEKMAFFTSLLGGLGLPSLPSSTASNPGVQLAMTGLDPVFLGRVLKSNTRQMASPASPGQWTAFVRPYGQFAELDSKDGHIGFDSTTAGALVGIQGQVHKNLALGIAGGYSHITTDFNGSDSEGNIDSGHGAVFARYLNGQWRGDAVAGYTYRSFDMSRRVVVPMINALAESEHEGNEVAFQLKGAYDMMFGYLMVSPEVTASYTGLWQDGYTETGAGVANMIIDDSFNDSFRTTLGFRGAVKSKVANMTVVSEAHVHWAHEFLDRNNTINAAFAAFSGTTVNITSRPLPRDSGVAGLGILGMVRENLALSLNYDIEFGASDFLLQTVRAGAEYRF